jgi:hypothetical protein
MSWSGHDSETMLSLTGPESLSSSSQLVTFTGCTICTTLHSCKMCALQGCMMLGSKPASTTSEYSEVAYKCLCGFLSPIAHTGLALYSMDKVRSSPVPADLRDLHHTSISIMYLNLFLNISKIYIVTSFKYLHNTPQACRWPQS